jgi:hypothetical protein
MRIVDQVERTLDIPNRTRRHPVLMLLGAAAVGAIAAPMLLRAPGRLIGLVQGAMRLKPAAGGFLTAFTSAFRMAQRTR